MAHCNIQAQKQFFSDQVLRVISLVQYSGALIIFEYSLIFARA